VSGHDPSPAHAGGRVTPDKGFPPHHRGGVVRGQRHSSAGCGGGRGSRALSCLWQQRRREEIPCSNTDITEEKDPKGRPPERT